MGIRGPESPPLDPSLYDLNEDEKTFFKLQTGIRDEAQLRDHILAVQKEAYAVFPYGCIRQFGFTQLFISKHPAYSRALKIGESRKDAVFLELGCNMGCDIRQAVHAGYPLQNIIASDLHAEFWSLGHKLFKTTQEKFPVTFVEGDIFNDEFLPEKVSPVPTSSTPPAAIPPLPTLTSLAPLQHGISVIFIAAVFHLFDADKQKSIARRLGGLLSPVSGSMIFGWHLGSEDTEENKNGGMWMNSHGRWVWAHSATSWNTLWAGEGVGVFKPGDVVVEVKTVKMPQIYPYHGDTAPRSNFVLYWSVTRA